jgi:hypothetical protein
MGHAGSIGFAAVIVLLSLLRLKFKTMLKKLSLKDTLPVNPDVWISNCNEGELSQICPLSDVESNNTFDELII